MPLISVVTSVYKAGSILPRLHERLVKAIEPITTDFDIILVDDGSPDNAWEQMEKLSALDPRVKSVRLSRNFGQHYALTAGLHYATGDWVIVMDCDLQDRPEEIPRFYQKAREGFDIVFGARRDRQDSFFKKFSSRCFSWFFNALGGIKLDNSISNFSIASQKVVAVVRSMTERYRTYGLLLMQAGFQSAVIDIQHAEREEGRSSYSFARLVEMAFNLIVAYSNKPLELSVKLGMTISSLSILAAIVFVVRYFLHDVGVSGWTSLIVSLYFLFGLTFIILGIIGMYIGRIFEQIKGRPLFIVKETRNLE